MNSMKQAVNDSVAAATAIKTLQKKGWEVTTSKDGYGRHWICKPPGAYPAICRSVQQLVRYAG